jgi:hypothetical protein
LTLLNSLIGYLHRGKCEKLIEYQKRTFEFKGFSAELSGTKISLAEFNTEVKSIETAAETAKALDNFQFYICNDLSNPMMKEYLTKQDLAKYAKIRMSAYALILSLQNALEAFKADPQGQKDNLNKSVQALQNFVRSVTPELNTDEARKAVGDALYSVNLDEKEVDKALSNLK